MSVTRTHADQCMYMRMKITWIRTNVRVCLGKSVKVCLSYFSSPYMHNAFRTQTSSSLQDDINTWHGKHYVAKQSKHKKEEKLFTCCDLSSNKKPNNDKKTLK